MGVQSLAYVTFDIADPAYWQDLYTRGFGMQLLEREDGVIDVRCDETVSYTHLDVYKRQTHCRPPPQDRERQCDRRRAHE